LFFKILFQTIISGFTTFLFIYYIDIISFIVDNFRMKQSGNTIPVAANSKCRIRCCMLRYCGVITLHATCFIIVSESFYYANWQREYATLKNFDY